MTESSPKVALYNNLNSLGMNSDFNGPDQETPPDSTGAIGPNHYVEMVNHQIAVWTRNLWPAGGAPLGQLVGGGGPFCDPQIQWDPDAGRWLYAFLYCNIADPVQFFVVGWSRTADPTNTFNGWCALGVRTDPVFLDYPKLGHNSKYLIVGGNMYDRGQSTTNPPFISARIAWIQKPAKGVTTCPATGIVHFTASPLLNGDGATQTFTPVPVNTTTSSANGYVLSAYDPFSGAQTKLAVWHLDSSGVLHAHSDIAVDSFSVPAPAPQLGSANKIDTLDGRLTQAVGDPITGLWTQHTVGGAGGRSMVSWYEIKVSGSTAFLANAGNIASPSDFVFNGAVSPRADAGGTAVIYNRSSASIDPVIAAQIRFTATSSGNMEPGELVLATSPGAVVDSSCNSPNPGDPCRWGDYAGASPDPIVKDVVWGTSEFNRGQIGSAPAWADQNFALSFVTEPLAPTAVSATAGNGSAMVSWTPNTYIPTSPVTSYTIKAYVGSAVTYTLVVAASATSARVGGLANGVSYTFTVFATNSVGSSDESVHSNAVTPGRPTSQAPPTPEPGRTPVPQSSPPLPSPR